VCETKIDPVFERAIGEAEGFVLLAIRSLREAHAAMPIGQKAKAMERLIDRLSASARATQAFLPDPF
jgi:hypothetical protein